MFGNQPSRADKYIEHFVREFIRNWGELDVLSYCWSYRIGRKSCVAAASVSEVGVRTDIGFLLVRVANVTINLTQK